MDIEPFWSIGGWFFIFLDCMAASSSSSSSPSSICETYTKSYSQILFITLLSIILILLLFITVTENENNALNSLSGHQMVFSSSDTKFTMKRLLLHSPADSKTSTSDLHNDPKGRQKLHSSSSPETKRKKFGVEEHEVPSGPNPISNR